MFDEATSEANSVGASKYDYDRLGRLRKTTLNPQHSVEYKYDIVGNKTEVIDRILVSRYRGWKVTDPSEYGSGTYVVMKTVITDPSIATTTTTTTDYDILGRPVRALDAQGGATLPTYDVLGRVDAVVDRNQLGRRFVSDDLDRRTGEEWYDTPAAGVAYIGGYEYRFDAADNMTASWEYRRPSGPTWVEAHRYDWTFDALGRMSTEKNPFNLNLTYG